MKRIHFCFKGLLGLGVSIYFIRMFEAVDRLMCKLFDKGIKVNGEVLKVIKYFTDKAVFQIKFDKVREFFSFVRMKQSWIAG